MLNQKLLKSINFLSRMFKTNPTKYITYNMKMYQEVVVGSGEVLLHFSLCSPHNSKQNLWCYIDQTLWFSSRKLTVAATASGQGSGGCFVRFRTSTFDLWTNHLKSFPNPLNSFRALNSPLLKSLNLLLRIWKVVILNKQ